MRLVGYTHRSTDRQEDSPYTQERDMREWCVNHSHDLIRVYHEEVIHRVLRGKPGVREVIMEVDIKA